MVDHECPFGDALDQEEARVNVRMVPGIGADVKNLKKAVYGNGRAGLLHEVVVLKTYNKVIVGLLLVIVGGLIGLWIRGG